MVLRIELISIRRKMEPSEKEAEEKMNKLNNETIKCIIQHGYKASEWESDLIEKVKREKRKGRETDIILGPILKDN